MSETDLEERVKELEKRVSYLEKELDLSLDERRFKKRVRRIIPAGQELTIDGSKGYYQTTVDVLPGDLPHVVHGINEVDDIGWHVEDSDEDSIAIRIEEGLVNQ